MSHLGYRTQRFSRQLLSVSRKLLIYILNLNFTSLKMVDLGPVVQSIVSLTSSLRGQQVFCNFITKHTGIFVEKMRKASYIFSTKHIGIFKILMFDVLTKR